MLLDQQRATSSLAAGVLGDQERQARRDAARRRISIPTTDFWNSLDGLGGQSTYELGGSFNDGKGEPGQSNAVSHGCPPARFRQVNVLNTAETIRQSKLRRSRNATHRK